jgi:WD40 repeat protein
VEWSSDGRYLASVGKDNLVHVWDPRRFELVRRFTLAGSYITGTSLAWSPDGTRFAAGDAKGIQIFDPQHDVPLQTLPDPVDATFDNIELAGWSADGTRLGAFVTFERVARVWDVAKVSRLQTFSVGLWRSLTE